MAHPADGDLLGSRAVGRRARRPARLPHPDDDRRAAVGDRHRRHGPPRAAQRARDVRPGRRGRRRRDDPAARQDRHHHLRQPPGDRAARGATASSDDELVEAAYLSSLADETPEGRSIVELAAAGLPDETRTRLRPRCAATAPRSWSSRRRRACPAWTSATAQPCARVRPMRSCSWVSRQGGQVPPEVLTDGRRASPGRAALPSSSRPPALPSGPGRSGSSTSRTSSSPA